MAQIIVCCAQKGGCAKTVTVHNLSYALSRMGKRVLAVDFDALLDMDEKGKDAPVQDTAVADRPRAAARMYAAQPKRPSVLEKLKARQAEVAVQSSVAPARVKEPTL